MNIELYNKAKAIFTYHLSHKDQTNIYTQYQQDMSNLFSIHNRIDTNILLSHPKTCSKIIVHFEERKFILTTFSRPDHSVSDH